MPSFTREEILQLDLRRVWRRLAMVAVLVMIVGAVIDLTAAAGLQHVEELRSLFSLDEETNVPTLLAVVLLATVSMGAGFVAVLQRGTGSRERPGWTCLSAVMGVMATDEFIQAHESVNYFMGRALAATRLGSRLQWPWVLVGAAAVVVAAIVFLPFLRWLDAPVRNRLLLGGVLYVSGVLGMEALSGPLYDEAGTSVLYALVTSVEEGLEVTGVLIAMSGVFRQLTREMGDRAVVVRGA